MNDARRRKNENRKASLQSIKVDLIADYSTNGSDFWQDLPIPVLRATESLK